MVVDIDECSEGVNQCSENSTCTNTIGSYQCFCFSGYRDEGMGYVCTGKWNICVFFYLISSFLLEIDECLNDPCDSNATCTNTARSYICECNTGFSGSGFTCTSMTDTLLLCFSRTMITLLFTQISTSVMKTQIHVMVMLPAAIQRVAMTVNVMLVTQEMDSHAQVSTVCGS